MHHAIRIHEHGGPEVMKWEQVPTPSPGPGEALVRHKAVGLNYIDVYFRTGLYKPPGLPCVIGMEGAGVVEAVGEGVSVVAPGDRVAYATAPIGAYAEARTIKADRLVKQFGEAEDARADQAVDDQEGDPDRSKITAILVDRRVHPQPPIRRAASGAW